MKINKKYLWVILICISILTFSMVRKTFENDTFYTIAIGDSVLENGVDMKDHYCFKAGLEYTYPHWLFDSIIGAFYRVWDFFGVYLFTVIASIVFSITMFVIMKKRKANTSIAFFITLFSIQLLSSLFVARAQLVSYLLLMIEFFVLEALAENKKFSHVLLLIVIPILIANMHAAVWYIYFIMYLPYFAEAFVEFRSLPNVITRKRDKLERKIKSKNLNKKEIKEIEKQINHYNKYLENKSKEKCEHKFYTCKNQNLKLMIFLFLLALVTGMITPIGDTPYTYLIKNTMGSSFEYITEQAKLVVADRADFQIVFILLIAIIGFTKTKLRIKDAFYILGFCVLAIISTRSVLFFVIFGMIILTKLITEFVESNNIDLQKLDNVMSKNVSIICVVLIVGFTAMMNYSQIINTKYVDESLYPVKAVEYMLKHEDIQYMNLYNDYNFGSYLLFNGIPVFVDSRSELYCKEFNEDVTIFDDYMSIINGDEHYSRIFDKYKITHILVKNDSIENVYISRDSKYKVEYQDDKFVLYEKKK